MVISDLYIERVSFFPDETDPPLVVDPDAVLTCPIFLKGFEMVTTIDRQHPEVSRGIQHQKLAASHLLDRLESDYGLIVEDGFGVRVLKRAYRHYADNITRCVKCPASCSHNWADRFVGRAAGVLIDGQGLPGQSADEKYSLDDFEEALKAQKTELISMLS